MDPNATLRDMLALAQKIHQAVDAGKPVDENDADELASLVIALDDWIEGGSSLPKRWMRWVD